MADPMTPDQIRAAILDRIDAAEGQCNSGYMMHADGVVRGLLWALTGADPGTRLFDDISKILSLAGLPVRVMPDGHVHYATTVDDFAELDKRCRYCEKAPPEAQ